MTQSGQPGDARRVMWFDADRLFYAGLLGKPSRRTLGAYASYLGLDGPLELSLDGHAWRPCALATVPPYVPHHVRHATGRIGLILVEPETVPPDAMPDWLSGESAAAAEALLERARQIRRQLGRAPRAIDFDAALFGQPLARRQFDPRIQAVVDAIKRDPCSQATGAEYAGSVHLSLSRFIHLFGQEMDVTFRRFRAWRRARYVLQQATSSAPLLDIAMAAGYADATHFSHSIRQACGLTPRDILAGSRSLELFDHGPPA